MFKVVLKRQGTLYVARQGPNFPLCMITSTRIFPAVEGHDVVVLSLSNDPFRNSKKFKLDYDREQEHTFLRNSKGVQIASADQTKLDVREAFNKPEPASFTFYALLEPKTGGDRSV